MFCQMMLVIHAYEKLMEQVTQVCSLCRACCDILQELPLCCACVHSPSLSKCPHRSAGAQCAVCSIRETRTTETSKPGVRTAASA
jgi:hypothetical protein